MLGGTKTTSGDGNVDTLRNADAFETEEDPRIPAGNAYFRIGEVAEILGVKPYVVRYWEAEFPWIRPEKTSAHQRRYRRRDVAQLLLIRRLRYEENLSVARTRELIGLARKKVGQAPVHVDEKGRQLELIDSLAARWAPSRAVPRRDPRNHEAFRTALARMRRSVSRILEATKE